MEGCGGVQRTGGGGGKVPVTLMSAPPVWPSTRWEHGMLASSSNMAQGTCREKEQEVPDTKALASEDEKMKTGTESSAKDEKQASC